MSYDGYNPNRMVCCPSCGERVMADHLETDSGDCLMCEERRVWDRAAIAKARS